MWPELRRPLTGSFALPRTTVHRGLLFLTKDFVAALEANGDVEGLVYGSGRRVVSSQEPGRTDQPLRAASVPLRSSYCFSAASTIWKWWKVESSRSMARASTGRRLSGLGEAVT